MQNKPGFSDYQGNLKWLYAGGGSLVPGISMFYAYAPPIIPNGNIFVGALSIAIICIVFLFAPRITKSSIKIPKKKAKKAGLCIFSAIILFIVYMWLLNYCTVLEPQNYSERFQVGFGKHDWSLTQAGLELKHEFPLAPLKDWMMTEGAFRQGGPDIIWKSWSVIAAGSLLACIYIISFSLWTFGFAFLAIAIKKDEKPKS